MSGVRPEGASAHVGEAYLVAPGLKRKLDRAEPSQLAENRGALLEV
jgi:hypothetical protein